MKTKVKRIVSMMFVLVLVQGQGISIIPPAGWAEVALPDVPAESTKKNETAESDSDVTLSKKITMDFKGVDVLDALNIIAKKSGLNIMAGNNVKGQVTFFLKDVDVWEALQLVLETSNLAYESHGDIIKVMTKADYEETYGKAYFDKKMTAFIQLEHARAQTIADTVSHITSTIGKIVVDEATNSLIVVDTPETIELIKQTVSKIDVPLHTRIFRLKYAAAEEIGEKLNKIITPNVGAIDCDNRTNKIVVTDIVSKINHIRNIVAAFDEKPQQVLIEAKIIEVALDDEYTLGIDWNLVFQRTEGSPISYAANSLGGIDVPNTSGPLSGLSGSDLPMFTMNSSQDQFNAVISALEGMGKTNTLSNPRVAVLNNEEASIAVATRQPFVSQTVVQGDNTSTTADNVEFVDVGVTLSVTPSITQDHYILMAVEPKVSTAGNPLTLTSTDVNGQQFTRTVVPVVTSQEVTTKVVVKDGATIVLGGLIQDSQSVKIRKVPLLGDIPLVGALFRNKSDDFKKTELVVFITPHILSPDETSGELSKYENADGRNVGFNEMGGEEYDFNRLYYRSQSYLNVGEKPFWEVSPARDLFGSKKKRSTEIAWEREVELQMMLELAEQTMSVEDEIITGKS